MITGSQCRAARALVKISRPMLSRRSGVDVRVIERFENTMGRPETYELEEIKSALEELGAVFIPENGLGHGVRLKFSDVDAAQIVRRSALDPDHALAVDRSPLRRDRDLLQAHARARPPAWTVSRG